MPENDTRGLHELQQVLLVNGKVTKYEGDEKLEERTDPAYIDMLSENRSDSDYSSRNNGSAQKSTAKNKTKKVLKLTKSIPN